MKLLTIGVVLTLVLSQAGCSSQPAKVSSGELAGVRESYSGLKPGMSKSDALGAFKNGNKVKLGAATIDGAHIEEWKVEAFNDRKGGKDLFVTFLYFCNDKLVDSSDTRIAFRDRPELVERWRNTAK